MAPTFGFASLPPKGALAPWGGPAALKAPTFGFASLPPERALAPWGGPAALTLLS
jgi:general secretion pathway protein J